MRYQCLGAVKQKTVRADRCGSDRGKSWPRKPSTPVLGGGDGSSGRGARLRARLSLDPGSVQEGRVRGDGLVRGRRRTGRLGRVRVGGRRPRRGRSAGSRQECRGRSRTETASAGGVIEEATNSRLRESFIAWPSRAPWDPPGSPGWAGSTMTERLAGVDGLVTFAGGGPVADRPGRHRRDRRRPVSLNGRPRRAGRVSDRTAAPSRPGHLGG